MQNVSIKRASELPQPMKAAVEQLLGRPIAPDEEISVAAIPPQQIPASGSRAKPARKLEAYLDRRAEKVEDIPEAEIDTVLDQAVGDVRHRRG